MSEVYCYRCTTPLTLSLKDDRYECEKCGIREDYQAYVYRTSPGPYSSVWVTIFLGSILSIIVVILALALNAAF